MATNQRFYKCGLVWQFGISYDVSGWLTFGLWFWAFAIKLKNRY